MAPPPPPTSPSTSGGGEGDRDLLEEAWSGKGMSGAAGGKEDTMDRAGRLAQFREAGTGGCVGVEMSRMGERYLVSDGGDRFIASSERPDGSRRKEIRVRRGYMPIEEHARFRSGIAAARESAGILPYSLDKRGGEGTNSFPPGYVPPSDQPVKSKKGKKKTKNESAATAEATAAAGCSSSTVSTTTTGDKSRPTKNSRGRAPITVQDADLCEPMGRLCVVSERAPDGSSAPAASETSKRLRNVRKKLREIEALERTLEGRAPDNVAQQEKLARKDEVLKELEELEQAQN